MSVIVRRICLWKLLPRFARGRLGEVWVAATFVCGDTQFWICTSGHGPIFLQSNTGKEYFHNPISCPYKENWTCLGQFGHSWYCGGVPEESPELGHQVADGNVSSEARIWWMEAITHFNFRPNNKQNIIIEGFLCSLVCCSGGSGH